MKMYDDCFKENMATMYFPFGMNKVFDLIFISLISCHPVNLGANLHINSAVLASVDRFKDS